MMNFVVRQVGLLKKKPSRGLQTLQGAAAIVEGSGHGGAVCTGRAGRVLRNLGSQPFLLQGHEVALGLDLEVIASKGA